MVDKFNTDEDKNLQNDNDGKEGQEELNVPVDAAGNVDPDKAAPGDFPFPASVGPTPAYKTDEEKKAEADKADKEGCDEDHDHSVDDVADETEKVDNDADKPVDKLKAGKKVPKQAPGSTDVTKNTPQSHTDFFKPDGNDKL